jgi:hypothetical protein
MEVRQWLASGVTLMLLVSLEGCAQTLPQSIFRCHDCGPTVSCPAEQVTCDAKQGENAMALVSHNSAPQQAEPSYPPGPGPEGPPNPGQPHGGPMLSTGQLYPDLSLSQPMGERRCEASCYKDCEREKAVLFTLFEQTKHDLAVLAAEKASLGTQLQGVTATLNKCEQHVRALSQEKKEIEERALCEIQGLKTDRCQLTTKLETASQHFALLQEQLHQKELQLALCEERLHCISQNNAQMAAQNANQALLCEKDMAMREVLLEGARQQTIAAYQVMAANAHSCQPCCPNTPVITDFSKTIVPNGPSHVSPLQGGLSPLGGTPVGLSPAVAPSPSLAPALAPAPIGPALAPAPIAPALAPAPISPALAPIGPAPISPALAPTVAPSLAPAPLGGSVGGAVGGSGAAPGTAGGVGGTSGGTAGPAGPGGGVGGGTAGPAGGASGGASGAAGGAAAGPASPSSGSAPGGSNPGSNSSQGGGGSDIFGSLLGAVGLAALFL